jgi:hypothetical protein
MAQSTQLNFNADLTVALDPQNQFNPRKRVPDFLQVIQGMTCSNPQTAVFTIPPSGTKSVFSGVDTTGIDGVMSFAVTINPVLNSTYRWTTAGLANFRTDRNINLNACSVVVTINNNATATFTIASGAGSFVTCVVGDIFFPGLTTGDSTGPFSYLNQGTWQIIAKSSTFITCIRAYQAPFVGVAETVAVTAQSQALAFSSSGVQIGDTMLLSGAFSSASWGAYVVTQVTPQWVEATVSSAIPLESGIVPTSSQMQFFNAFKRFVWVQTDQPAVVQFNGDSGVSNTIQPILTPQGSVGFLIKVGNAFSLSVINQSTVNSMQLIVFSVE